MEQLQNQQAEDNRGISKQQKNTERFLAKKQMLLNRKDECARNIRDLGVLPEEAFEKYTGEKLDRVRRLALRRYTQRFSGATYSSSRNCMPSTKASRNSLT